MLVNSEHKTLWAIFVLVFLIAFSQTLTAPKAYAWESSIDENSLNVLNDVVGFDLTIYTPNLIPHEKNTSLFLPEETDFQLSAQNSQARVRCTYLNGRLNRIFVSDIIGNPLMNFPTANPIDAAKDFLQRYQNYTDDPFYSQLISTLDTANTTNDFVKTTGNVQLEITHIGSSQVDLTWTYIDENGVSAPAKDVSLCYRDGFLKSFLDNWQFYKVAGTPSVSAEQARIAALNACASYSWEVMAEAGEKQCRISKLFQWANYPYAT
jgi:hypothetical protein